MKRKVEILSKITKVSLELICFIQNNLKMAYTIYLVLFNWLLFSVQPAIITRLGLGTVLHKEIPIQLQSNYWRHIVILPIPQKLPVLQVQDPCIELYVPRDEGVTKRPPGLRTLSNRWHLCAQFEAIRTFAKTMNSTLAQDINFSLDTLYSVLVDTAREHEKSNQTVPVQSRKKRHGTQNPGPYSVTWLPTSREQTLGTLSAGRLLSRRHKRAAGLIVAMGSLIAGLAGASIYHHVSMERRLQSLEAVVRDLDAANQKMIDSLSRDLFALTDLTVKYMNMTNKRLDRMAQYLNTIAHVLNDLSGQIQRLSYWYHRWAAYTEYIVLAYIQSVQGLQQYAEYIHRLGLGIHSLTRGQLSPYLITHHDLQVLYDVVSQRLLETLPSYKIGLPHVESLYHLPLEAVVLGSDVLYISLAIPITDTADVYEVYRIQTFPVRAGLEASQHFTQITNVPDYIAVLGNYFIEMSHEEYERCVGDLALKTCFSRHIEHDFSQTTCALALYQNNVKFAVKYCESVLILNEAPRDILIPLSADTLYIVSLAEENDEWTISCMGRRPEIVEACVNCEIQLPCQCSLRTSHAYYPAPLDTCDDFSSVSELYVPAYVKNIVYLAHILKQQDVSSLVQDPYTYSRSEAMGPNISHVIDLYMDPAEYDAENQRMLIDLNHLKEEEMQNRNEWYQNRAATGNQLRKMATSALGTSTRVFFALIGLSIVMGIIGILVCVLTGKYKTLAASLGLMTQLPRGNSAPMSPIDPVCTSIASSLPTYVQVIYMTVVTLFCLILIGKQLIKLYLRRHAVYRAPMFFQWATGGGRVTKILLELGNAAEFVLLDLQTLTGSPLRYRLSDESYDAQELPRLTYQRSCWTHALGIDWRQFALYDEIRQLTVPLKTIVRVPYPERGMTKRILLQPLSLRLLVGSQGVYDSIPIVIGGNAEIPDSAWRPSERTGTLRMMTNPVSN